MVQDHNNFGTKFYRRNPRLAKSSENIGLGKLAETTNDSITGVAAIPSCYFLPSQNSESFSVDISNFDVTDTKPYDVDKKPVLPSFLSETALFTVENKTKVT